MTVTIPDVMRHVRNYFVSSRIDGVWEVQEGRLLPEGPVGPGDWIAIPDGPLAGVHQLDEYGGIPGASGMVKSAVWEGRICLLTPPPGFIRLCCEIAAWAKRHDDPTMTSESFGEYARRQEPGDWTQVFRASLAPYTRMYPEVSL